MDQNKGKKRVLCQVESFVYINVRIIKLCLQQLFILYILTNIKNRQSSLVDILYFLYPVQMIIFSPYTPRFLQTDQILEKAAVD